MTHIVLNFSLDQIAEMAAKLVQAEQVIKDALDTLEKVTGLPLREAANRMDRKPLTPP